MSCDDVHRPEGYSDGVERGPPQVLVSDVMFELEGPASARVTLATACRDYFLTEYLSRRN